MTELVSATTCANTILSRCIRHISATRIQRTWKSWKIEMESEIQRAQARLHKFENLNEPSWKNKSDDQVVDPLESMGVKKKGKTVTFGEKNVAKYRGKTFFEKMNDVDGKMKSQTIFTNMVNTWFSSPGDKSSFFEQGFIKEWINDPTSSHWTEYLDDTINLLENSGFVLLWGNSRGHKRLYLKDKKEMNDIRDHWKLYQLKKQIFKLKEESKKTIENQRKRKSTSLSGGLNPRAKVFTMEPSWQFDEVFLKDEGIMVDYTYLD